MRVHCDRCRAPADLDRLDAVDGGFGFRCAACGAVNVLAPAPDAAPPAPSQPPTDREPPPPGTVECPKCQHWQPAGGRACHRCGLMFAYAATGRARLPGDPLEAHPAAATIRAKWAALADDLDDTEGHHAFIRLCAEADLLEYAGFCYRRLADRGRGEDPRVAAYRRRVLEAAMAGVGRVASRAVERDTTRLRRLVALLVVAAIVFIFAFGYYLLTRYQVTRQFEGRRPPIAQPADRLAIAPAPGHHAPMLHTPPRPRVG